MATSSTFASFTIADIMEEAYERAGLELRSGYDLKTGTRSLNFLLAEWANKGLNLWTLDQGTQEISSGIAEYTMDADTVDLVEYSIQIDSSGSTTNMPLERISFSQYAQLTNPEMTGDIPLQIMVQRGSLAPVIRLWPVPNQECTLVYWRLRRMEAAGNVDNNPDVPFRFIPPLVAGLAYMIASKRPEAASRVPYLKTQYDEAWDLASSEDRDRASVFFVPDVS